MKPLHVFPDWANGEPYTALGMNGMQLTDAQLIAVLTFEQNHFKTMWLNQGVCWVETHLLLTRSKALANGKGIKLKKSSHVQEMQIEVSRETAQCLQIGYWLRHVSLQLETIKARQPKSE